MIKSLISNILIFSSKLSVIQRNDLIQLCHSNSVLLSKLFSCLLNLLNVSSIFISQSQSYLIGSLSKCFSFFLQSLHHKTSFWFEFSFWDKEFFSVFFSFTFDLINFLMKFLSIFLSKFSKSFFNFLTSFLDFKAFLISKLFFNKQAWDTDSFERSKVLFLILCNDFFLLLTHLFSFLKIWCLLLKSHFFPFFTNLSRNLCHWTSKWWSFFIREENITT